MNMSKPFAAFLAVFLAALPAAAQDHLNSVLPLLQKQNRTLSENAQVLQLFRSSKTPNIVFAAGASLVKTPPPPQQQAALFNLVIRNDDVLKKVFAAVIITAMGAVHEELTPVLQDATQSQDNALRSYAASAYTILNPKDKTYSDSVVNLYIYDEAFAQRAMNLLAESPKQLFKYLKQACSSQDAQVRAAAAAWLGDLQTEDAAKQLLKMAKSELNPQTGAAIATALAKNKIYTLPAVVKELKLDYTSPKSATYALALGFMTGSAIDSIKTALNDKNANVRINAVRAAAYMAGVLSSKDAALYTDDKAFDVLLLKGLIPQLNMMLKKDNASVKVYADNALNQISKLMR